MDLTPQKALGRWLIEALGENGGKASHPAAERIDIDEDGKVVGLS